MPLFECGADPIEVSGLHRPDISWHVVDKKGHRHRWYVGGKIARHYDPLAHYKTPTLKWKRTGTGYYDDGEPYELGHHECRKCGQQVEPGYTADVTAQYIAGLKWFKIDGVEVTQAEFQKRYKAAQKAAKR